MSIIGSTECVRASSAALGSLTAAYGFLCEGSVKGLGQHSSVFNDIILKIKANSTGLVLRRAGLACKLALVLHLSM